MRTTLVGKFALGLTFALLVAAGGPAGASHCSSRLEILSRAAGTTVNQPPLTTNVPPNANANWVCRADDQGVPTPYHDTHLINPGSTEVLIQWTVTAKTDPGADNVVAVLNGLGFSNTRVTAKRLSFFLTYYETPTWTAIPAGPAGVGKITASVYRIKAGTADTPTGAPLVTDCYHTVGGNC